MTNCRTLGVLVAIGLLAFSAQAQVPADDAPATPPARPSTARPARADPKWGSPNVLSLRSEGAPVFAAADGQFVLIADALYTLGNFHKVNHFGAAYDEHGPCALSSDGKYFAAKAGGTKAKSDPLCVWQVAGSKLIQTLPLHGNHGLEQAEFIQPTQLAVAYQGENFKLQIDVIDVTTGKELQTVAVGEFEHKGICFSPAGAYAAVASTNDVRVFSLETGDTVATMHNPTQGFSGYRMLEGLRFSHTGKELAALTPMPAHIIAWDATGELIADFEPCVNLNDPKGIVFGMYHGNGIEWVGDDSGWLLCGRCIVDRESKLPVWTGGLQAGWYGPNKVTDQDHIACLVTSRQSGILRVSIPWARIHAAMKKMASTPAYVGPGQPVSLEVTVGSVRFAKPEDVTAELTKALTEGLANAGLKVEKDQPAVFQIKYEEKAGPQRQFRTFGSRTEQSVESTSAKGTVSLVVRDKGTVLWSQEFNGDLGMFFAGELTPTSYRNGAFKAAVDAMRHLSAPFFIPRDAKQDMLPIVTPIDSN